MQPQTPLETPTPNPKDPTRRGLSNPAHTFFEGKIGRDSVSYLQKKQIGYKKYNKKSNGAIGQTQPNTNFLSNVNASNTHRPVSRLDRNPTSSKMLLEKDFEKIGIES
jgi:hypothetical protein